MGFLAWFYSYAPDDPQVVRVRAFGVLTIMVLFIFFGAGGTASTAAMVILVVSAMLILIDNAARTLVLRMPETATAPWSPTLHLALAACLFWQLAGWLAARPSNLASIQSLGGTIAVISLVVIVQSAVGDRFGTLITRLLQVIFWAGALSAAVSIGLYLFSLSGSGLPSFKAITQTRLVPIGRAYHEIASSAALAISAFAGIVLFVRMPIWQRLLAIPGLLGILLAMALTQSRGPALGLILAVALFGFLWLIRAARPRAALAVAMFIFACFLPVLTIVAEESIKNLICASDELLCRQSKRLQIWQDVIGKLPEAPWFGFGPHARVQGELLQHPHNGLLGSAFFFGVPMLIPLIVLCLGSLLSASRHIRSEAGMFCVLSLNFAFVTLGTDRPNLFGDLNSHFLYLWLPIALAFSLDHMQASPPPSRQGGLAPATGSH